MRLSLKQKNLILIGFGCLVISEIHAQEVSMNVSYKGTLIDPPPCTMNSVNPILVNFGHEVISTQVNGANYMQPIDYRVTCPADSPKGMRFKIEGASMMLDEQRVLNAGKNGLGIKLYNGSTAMNSNQWYNFTYPSTPQLKAAPTKAANADLILGQFSVTATLSIDYQ